MEKQHNFLNKYRGINMNTISQRIAVVNESIEGIENMIKNKADIKTAFEKINTVESLKKNVITSDGNVIDENTKKLVFNHVDISVSTYNEDKSLRSVRVPQSPDYELYFDYLNETLEVLKIHKERLEKVENEVPNRRSI